MINPRSDGTVVEDAFPKTPRQVWLFKEKYFNGWHESPDKHTIEIGDECWPITEHELLTRYRWNSGRVLKIMYHFSKRRKPAKS